MKQLRIFDKYSAPPEWKEAVIMRQDKTNTRVFLKRRYFTAVICAVVLICAGVYALGYSVSKDDDPRINGILQESVGEGTDGDENSRNIDYAAERNGEHFRAVIVQVRENGVMICKDGEGLIVVSFEDNCEFFGSDNSKTDFSSFKIGDTVVVNYDGTIMELYPEMINSCKMLQTIGSLKEGEYISDLTGTYFSGKVYEISQEAITVETVKDGLSCYYSVRNDFGYIYDGSNRIISTDNIKTGMQIRVKCAQPPEMYDIDVINSDIIQVSDTFTANPVYQPEAEAEFTVREYAAENGSLLFEAKIENEQDVLLLDTIINDYIEKIKADPNKKAYDLMPLREFSVRKGSDDMSAEYLIYETGENIYFSTDMGDLEISKKESSAADILRLLDEISQDH